MIRINLLPHREAKRKARRQQFYSLTALVAVFALMLAFLVYTLIGTRISQQESKNEFLKREIAVLDSQVDQIKRLKEQMQLLIARKSVIESLQRNRAEAVHVFNELARGTPDGVYLKSIKQSVTTISLSGYAQSNSRVSTLMRNLEASQWLEKPNLVEIKSVILDKRRLNEFTLTVQLTQVKDESDTGQPARQEKGKK